MLKSSLSLVNREHISDNRQRLGVLGKVFHRGSVGKKTALFAPELLYDFLFEPLALLQPIQGLQIVAEGSLDLCSRLHGENVEEIYFGAYSVAKTAVGGRTLIRPIDGPIHEAPAGKILQKPIGVLIILDSRERLSHPRDAGSKPFAVCAAGEIVAVHAQIAKRISVRLLNAARRKIHRTRSVVARRELENFDRALYDSVVARHGGENEKLNAGVAGVHLLLVIRAVEKHFMTAHLHCSCADFADLGESAGFGGLEGAFKLDGIARFDQVHILQDKRLAERFDIDTAPASATEPRGREFTLKAVRNKIVAVPLKVFPENLRTVGLSLGIFIAGRFGPGPGNASAFGAFHFKNGICARINAEIDGQLKFGISGHNQFAAVF